MHTLAALQHTLMVCVDIVLLGCHTQTRASDVTDQPQEDASYPTPSTADSDGYGQKFMQAIQDMAKDLGWRDEENAMDNGLSHQTIYLWIAQSLIDDVMIVK